MLLYTMSFCSIFVEVFLFVSLIFKYFMFPVLLYIMHFKRFSNLTIKDTIKPNWAWYFDIEQAI